MPPRTHTQHVPRIPAETRLKRMCSAYLSVGCKVDKHANTGSGMERGWGENHSEVQHCVLVSCKAGNPVHSLTSSHSEVILPIKRYVSLPPSPQSGPASNKCSTWAWPRRNGCYQGNCLPQNGPQHLAVGIFMETTGRAHQRMDPARPVVPKIAATGLSWSREWGRSRK